MEAINPISLKRRIASDQIFLLVIALEVVTSRESALDCIHSSKEIPYLEQSLSYLDFLLAIFALAVLVALVILAVLVCFEIAIDVKRVKTGFNFLPLDFIIYYPVFFWVFVLVPLQNLRLLRIDPLLLFLLFRLLLPSYSPLL